MEKILIADFDVANRNELSKILDGMYEINVAASGQEAVACLDTEKENLAVILYRFSMPGIDGYAFLEDKGVIN